MFGRIKKGTGLILALLLMFSSLPVTASAGENVGKNIRVKGHASFQKIGASPEKMCFDKLMYGSRSVSTYGTHSKDALTQAQKEVYHTLKPMIQEVSQNGGVTKFKMDLSKTPVLAQKICPNQEELSAYVRSVLSDTVQCLLYDIPEDTYWREGKYSWETIMSVRTISSGKEYQLYELTLLFPVSKEYRKDVNDEYTLDPSMMNVAKTSIDNAKNIASGIKNNGKSRLEQLRDIKNKICELTDYNHDALKPSYDKKDAWQLVNVFDNDPSTKVVCEGYAKSFQYLSDLVFSEDSSVEVYCPVGDMKSFQGSGPHMWNIVRFDGMGYHVDVTNCDVGMTGTDALFMLSPAAGSVTVVEPAKEYITHPEDPQYIYEDITYVYDPQSLKMYGEEVHTLAKEHNYGQLIVDVPATDKEPGKGHRICQICGTRVEEEIPAEPKPEKFDFYGTSMTMGNDLSLNYYVEKAKLNGRQDLYAKITRSYSNGKPDTYEIKKMADWDDKTDYYSISYKGLAAKEMNDKVVMQIFDHEGNALSNIREDSIHDYAVRILEKPSTIDEFKTCVVNMLNYGSEAQLKFDYDKTNPANRDIDQYQKFATKDFVLGEGSKPLGERYYGTSLILEKNINLNLYYTGIDDVAYARVTYNDHYGHAVERTIQAENFKVQDGYKSVKIDSLLVSDVSQDVTCVLYDKTDHPVSTVVDSIENYCARIKEKGDLYVSIMKFGVSAREYFKNR